MILNYFKKNKKFGLTLGFTVLESIVAIFVLSVAISGAFTAVQTSLSQSTISKDEVKAFYLAQEAVEIIRNKRDANQLSRISGVSTSWLSGFAENSGDPCYFGKVCRVESSLPTTFVTCGNSWDTCPNLRQDSSSYLIGYNGAWGLTNFKREIMMGAPSADEIAVVVRVIWTKGARTYEFKAKTHMFNWVQ